MKRLGLLVGIVCLFASASLGAQEPVSLAPGMRVRVRVPTIYRQWLVGTVESADSGTLVVRSEQTRQAGLFSLPLTAIERIDLSRGMMDQGKGSTVRGREGLLAGLGIAGAVLLVGVGSPEGGSSSGPTFKQVATLGGGLGALGWLVGSVAGGKGGERWETVAVSGFQVGLAREPASDGSP